MTGQDSAAGSLRGRRSTQVPRWAARLLSGRTMRVLVVRCLGIAALFGLEITLARALGADGYGAFSFALAVATVISRLAPLGWLNASMRFVSAYMGTGQWGLLKGSLVLSHVATAGGLAAATVLAVLAGQATDLFGGDHIVAYALPLSFALALLELHRYVLRGFHEGDLGEALPLLLLPASVVALIWVLAVREPGAAIYLYSAVCLLLVVVSSILIGRRLPAALWATAAEFRSREWFIIALPMLVGAASTELLARAGVIVLGALSTDHAVGLYQAAARLSLMNVFILRAITPVAGPRISELYHRGESTELRATYRRACLLSLLGCMPFFVCFVIFPEYVLSWFGREFVDAAPILRVLSIGYLISAAAGPAATGLMMIGRQRVYGAVAVVALMATVLGSYVMVQYAGALGAAIVTATVVALINLVNGVIFFRVTR